MSQATRQKSAGKGRRDEVKQQLQKLPLLGNIITWSPGGANHKYIEIVRALKDATLNDTVARELLPRYAFQRACRKLDEERVIDHLKEDADSITFQFTKKTISDDTWKYYKETNLVINKVTGVVTCPLQELQLHAQREVNRCMEERTSNDITKIVQKLFDLESEGCPMLFPIRDQGGAYFVFQKHQDFVERIKDFLTRLGGELTTFPVADAEAYGGKNTGVANTVASTVEAVITEHEEAVAAFGLDTRQTTLEAQATKIKETRVRIQALADHLGDRVQDLLKSVDAANQKLTDRIEELATTRSTAPPKAEGRTEGRSLIFGHSVTSVLRWMGKNLWTFKDARRCLNGLNLSEIAEGTIRAQLQAGRNGERGPAAHITNEQAEELRKTIEEYRARRKAEREAEEASA